MYDYAYIMLNHCTYPFILMTGQLHRESVILSVVSHSVTPVTTLMSTALFLVIVIPAHTILKYVRQSTGALDDGLCALEGLMQSSTLR